MSDGLYVAMSGAVAQERAMDVTANNVANANTKGFRAERVTFEEVLGGQGNLSFVSADEASVDTSRGELRSTGNPLDVAVDGCFRTVYPSDDERVIQTQSASVFVKGARYRWFRS